MSKELWNSLSHTLDSILTHTNSTKYILEKFVSSAIKNKNKIHRIILTYFNYDVPEEVTTWVRYTIDEEYDPEVRNEEDYVMEDSIYINLYCKTHDLNVIDFIFESCVKI